MRKVTVGKKTVVHSCTLMMADDEVVRMELTVPEDQSIGADLLRIELKFTERSASSASVNWITEDGVVKFTFIGWRVPGGSSLAEPLNFGTSNDERLWLHAAHQTILGTNVAHILVMRGG
jgi:hypothetical protein